MFRNIKIGSHELFCFFIALMGTSLYWSFYLISISSIFLSILIVFDFDIYPQFRIRFNSRIRTLVSVLTKNPLLLCFILLFFLGLISYFWSEDMYYWEKYNQMRLQLLIVPLSIMVNNPIEKKYLDWILKLFVIAAVITAIIVFYYYLMNYEFYIYALDFSKAIYTPVQHIRYSTLLVMAFGTGLYLFKSEVHLRMRYIWLTISAFILILLHILAVKGSLLSLYILCIAIPFTLLKYSVIQKYRYALPFVLVIILALSLIYIPSLNKKLQYVKFEMSEYKAGRWQNLSDIERLISYDVGWELGMRNPLTGVGLGDFEKETKEIYKNKWLASTQVSKLPHNEIIFQFMSLGLIAVLLLFGIYYFIIREKVYRTDFVCLSFLIPLFFLQLFNDTLESQTTVGTIVFTLIIIYNRKYLLDLNQKLNS